LSYSWSNGPTIRINASDLGNTRRLTFAILAVSNVVYDDATGDISCGAPDCYRELAPAFGLYSPYSVIIAKPTLVVKKTSSTPKSPVAGKQFTFRMTAARSDTGATIKNGRVTCKGRVGTTALKARTARVVRGAVTCTWLIPAKAKGKRFRGSAAVTFEGLKATRSYSGKIR
jgi:hypothetical protein